MNHSREKVKQHNMQFRESLSSHPGTEAIYLKEVLESFVMVLMKRILATLYYRLLGIQVLHLFSTS